MLRNGLQVRDLLISLEALHWEISSFVTFPRNGSGEQFTWVSEYFQFLMLHPTHSL
jgi:hypothetical protein